MYIYRFLCIPLRGLRGTCSIVPHKNHINTVSNKCLQGRFIECTCSPMSHASHFCERYASWYSNENCFQTYFWLNGFPNTLSPLPSYRLLIFPFQPTSSILSNLPSQFASLFLHVLYYLEPHFNSIDRIHPMEKYVSLTPGELHFQVTLGRISTTGVTIKNISDTAIAYKVKTTRPKRYCVVPFAAVLQPDQHINVELRQQAFRSLPEDVERDRFLLQVIQLDNVPKGQSSGPEHGYATAMELWTCAPSQHVVQSKFTVRMEIVPSPDLDYIHPPAAPVLITKAVPLSPTPTTPKLPTPYIPEKADQSSDYLSLPEPFVPPKPLSPSPNYQLTSSKLPPRPKTLSESHPSTTVERPTSSEAASLSQSESIRSIQTNASVTESPDVDYQSVEYARARALNIRTVPKIELPEQDENTRHRIAVERAAELMTVINLRQKDIDIVDADLTEARQRLTDARTATKPAYDIRYEVNESARVPVVQIAIMGLIAGALIQLII